MKTQYTVGLAMLASAAFGAIQPAYAQQAGAHSMVTPDQLQWKDVPALGLGVKSALIEGPMNEAVPFIVRIKFPAGTKVPAHWHPNIEHVTVMSGNFIVGVGDEADKSKAMHIPSGSVTIMQPKTTHFAFFDEETTLQVHGVGPWEVVYVNPADDPRNKKTN
jgi:quercetin dioxygenase-like cupin family protein